jgi:MFS family permease
LNLEKASKRLYYGWIIVIASFFICVMAYGGSHSFGVFFKFLRDDFGWTSAATSGAFSFYMILQSVLAIPSGWATDKFGPRRIIILGALLLGLGLSLTSQISALWQLYATYGFLMGVGMSVFYSPLLATTSRWFAKRRGLALGIVSAGIGAGTLIMAPLANYLILTYGWRASYLMIGPAIGIIIIVGASFLKKDQTGLGLVPGREMLSRMIAKGREFSEAENNIASNSAGLSLRGAFSTRVFWLLCLINLMVGFGLQMILVHIVPYIQEGPKLSPTVAAAGLSIIGGASIAGKLVMGAASDRIGRKRALAISVCLEGIAILGFMSSSVSWMLYLFAVIYGFGYGGHVPQLAALVGEIFGLRYVGTSLGMTTLFWGIGGALGSFLAGYIFDINGSYNYAFMLGAGAMFLATVLTPLLKSGDWLSINQKKLVID